jgi:hypothetical protein
MINSNDGTTLKNTGELRCNGNGIRSCSTCGTRGVILVTNQVRMVAVKKGATEQRVSGELSHSFESFTVATLTW